MYMNIDTKKNPQHKTWTYKIEKTAKTKLSKAKREKTKYL